MSPFYKNNLSVNRINTKFNLVTESDQLESYIVLYEETLEKGASIKCLGLNIDSKLTWRNNKLYTNSAPVVFLLSKLVQICPVNF